MRRLMILLLAALLLAGSALAEGFDSAAEAMNAAFGANYNPWGGDATNWQ